MKKALALVVIAILACGKRGDPRPPVPVIPQATSDLVVTQRGSNVILSWSYPSMTTAGKSLTKVRRVVVYRHVMDLASPSMPPLPVPQFNKLKERVDSIEGANLPAASAGARLTFTDAPPFHTKDGHPVRVTYSVVTEGEAAKGDLSNLAVITPLDVPVAPAALTATPKAEGIVLTWTAPTTSVTPGAKPLLVGYNVYRDGDAAPATSTPVVETTYTDTPPYGDHAYRVTAVGAAGTPRIESDLSAPARATYKDLLPPPTPTGLTALVETKAVRLVWDAVDTPDLAGYKIYRSEGSGEVLKVVARIPLTPQPITATNYRDVNVNVGISYFYEVTAVDKSGNESKPAKTDWVLAPKTN